MVNDMPVLTPEEDQALCKDGSYPSGHTSVGWKRRRVPRRGEMGDQRHRSVRKWRGDDGDKQIHAQGTGFVHV